MVTSTKIDFIKVFIGQRLTLPCNKGVKDMLPTRAPVSEPYAIGTQFTLKRGKSPAKDCTIVDHLFTYNSKGELVKMRYVTKHLFCGQWVFDYDVVHTTIAMAIGR